jgi:FixJ family two-component response regulator
MMDAAPMVFVIDDDSSVREALRKLIMSVGMRVETFGSAREFMLDKRPEGPACIVLDVRLPDVSGLEFQRVLAKAGVQIPIIFISGHADVPLTVRAMKEGAVEFLTKPFRGQELLDAIQDAIAKDREALRDRARMTKLRAHYDSLTQREKEVLELVVSGLLNKQIAAELGTSELTVKTHRAHVMKKMAAASLADLVRMSEKLGVSGRNR